MSMKSRDQSKERLTWSKNVAISMSAKLTIPLTVESQMEGRMVHAPIPTEVILVPARLVTT